MASAYNNVSEMIEDLGYLQEELEALKYVIPAVPYSERPPGAVSILDMIGRLKEQQERYYRPLIQNMVRSDSDQEVSWVDDKFQVADDTDMEELLNKTIKKRSSYVHFLRQVPERKWEVTADPDGQGKRRVAELLREHIEFERRQLKEVADIVMTLDPSRKTS